MSQYSSSLHVVLETSGASEKESVWRQVAVETNFRQEKEAILKAFGASPAVLLSPGADSRLQRKLNSYVPGESRVSNGTSSQEVPCIEEAAAVATVDDTSHDLLRTEEPPEAAIHHREPEEYAAEEKRNMKNRKFRFMLLVGTLCFFLISGVIVMITLFVRNQTQTSSAASNGGAPVCDWNVEAMIECSTGSIEVPECAQEIYEDLAQDIFPDQNSRSECYAPQFGLVATAVAKTENSDMADIQQYWSLATFYFALGGSSWGVNKGWLNHLSPCRGSWFGITCEAETIVGIDLESNSLQGFIPTEIGMVKSLQSLNLKMNNVVGNLPSEIGYLTNLEFLSFEETSLVGTLPSEIQHCQNLREINLLMTKLTGSIPSEIGNLNRLESLALSGTHISGSIPSEIGFLLNLQDLSLSGFQDLLGTIPSEMTGLVNLTRLCLCISSFGDLNFPSLLSNLPINLAHLDVAMNNMAGKIPSDIANLAKLTFLNVAGNSLSGTIPSELAVLTDLHVLDFSSNRLTGTIPTLLGSLTRLSGLSFSTNILTGTFPSELGMLSALSTLDLSQVLLSGTLPTEFCSVPLLEYDQCEWQGMYADCLRLEC